MGCDSRLPRRAILIAALHGVGNALHLLTQLLKDGPLD